MSGVGNEKPRVQAHGETWFPAVGSVRAARDACGMEAHAIQLGRLDVDEVLELVASQAPAPGTVVRGELVAPAAELVDAFADTLVARPQTQRTYRRACA